MMMLLVVDGIDDGMLSERDEWWCRQFRCSTPEKRRAGSCVFGDVL